MKNYLKTNKKKEGRYNDLWFEMHPLEIEVDDMIQRVRRWEKPFDDYLSYKEAKKKFDDIKNPVDYLKKYFWKYLNVFNGGGGDFLYQFQLEKIDFKFRGTLATFLHRKNIDVSMYILNKSNHLNREVDKYLESPLSTDFKVRKSRSLHQAKYCRKS